MPRPKPPAPRDGKIPPSAGPRPQVGEALVALGDREGAAEAEILLADVQWRAGHRDDADEHIDRAVALLEDVPSSPAKARVLSEVSRFHMLADRDEEAIRAGRDALALATALGLDEVRAHALDNIGSARVRSGDIAGLDDLERSVEIAQQIGSTEGIRGYNNLFVAFWLTGSLARAAESVAAGLEVADRFGGAVGIARWLAYQRVPVAYCQGRWDEALRLIEETLDEAGQFHYLSRWALETRGRIRLARSDTLRAVDDAKKGLGLAREAKDPQTLYPALSFAAFAFLSTGRHTDAELLADELLRLNAAAGPAGASTPATPVFDLAWVLAAFGRSGELAEAVERSKVPRPWTKAAGAIARGELLQAAEVYAGIGHLPNEAYTRLRAAEQLVAEGRLTEADEQLRKALSFFRSVRATRYVNEGETLLAATG